MLYSILHGSTPLSFNNHFQFNQLPTWSHLLTLTARTSTINAYRYSFYINTPFFWNSIPYDIFSLTSVNAFKSKTLWIFVSYVANCFCISVFVVMFLYFCFVFCACCNFVYWGPPCSYRLLAFCVPCHLTKLIIILTIIIVWWRPPHLQPQRQGRASINPEGNPRIS